MNPNISSSNNTGERLVKSSLNTEVKAPEMSFFNNPQQLKPIRMEQVRPEGQNRDMYQQNNQRSQQNNNSHYQQLQQNIHQNVQQQLNYQQHQQINYQRPQPNIRFSSNQDPFKTSLHNNNNFIQLNTYKNNQKGPEVPAENQRIQIAPQDQQQQNRPTYMSQNYSNIPNQLKVEASKSPHDLMQSNFRNVSQNDYYQTQALKNHSVNLDRKSSDLNLNCHRTPNVTERSNEVITKPQMGLQSGNISNSKTEMSSVSLNEQHFVPSTTETKSETEAFITSSNESKQTDIENSVNKKIIGSDIKKKEKNLIKHKNIIKDESITIGMVKKNIKFFEENDTTKKPLKPETPITKKENAQTPYITKRVANSKGESCVDETPVIHPNLRSIFQVPRKVAKIPRLKTNKFSKKLKSKRLLKDQIKKKSSPSEFLKPRHVCKHYKEGNGKKPKTEIYGSKEELLAFFESTKLWRELNRYENKTNQNVKKDKAVHKATANGDIPTPKQTPSKPQTPSKRNLPVSPTKTSLKSPCSPGTPGAKLLLKTSESPAPPTPLIKKVPMNKIQVGAAPSPNLKTVRSKVGSLANTTHKPGGGNVKIESHKVDLSNVQPRTEAKNEQYKRSGGDKKIQQVKLQWSAKPKIGSLENAAYKPGGGDKKIESVKLDFKEKAKPKVGSKDNVKYTPGGGNVKIENQKLEFKAQSKVGSLDNVKHKPGGGEIKIFDDKTYLRQVSGNSSEGRASGTQSPMHTSVSKSFSETSQDGS